MVLTQQQLWQRRKHRRALVDPTLGMFCHRTIPDATTVVGTGYLDVLRAKVMTFAIAVVKTATASDGIVYEFGNPTGGLALWFEQDGIMRFCAGRGTGAPTQGVTMQVMNPPVGRRMRVVAAVNPGDGKARVWVDGDLKAAAQASAGNMGGGWTDNANGRVNGAAGPGAPNNTSDRIPTASRIALANVSIIAPLKLYHNQLPRTFYGEQR